MPAKCTGIRDGGEIKERMCADIVIFNYERVMDGSTYEPSLYPEEIEYVLVNGQVVIDHDKHTGLLPGKVLRHESNNNIQNPIGRL